VKDMPSENDMVKNQNLKNHVYFNVFYMYLCRQKTKYKNVVLEPNYTMWVGEQPCGKILTFEIP